MSHLKFIVIVAIYLVVGLFIPVIPQNYVVNEIQGKTETYNVTVPYVEEQWETVQQPVEVQKPFDKLLISHTVVVAPETYYYYYLTIDLTDTSDNLIQGSVVETANLGINFLVFDQQGFTEWVESQGDTGTPYVSLNNIKSSSFSFIPTTTGRYYFVLDNTYSSSNNKRPQTTVDWVGVKTVTEMQSYQQKQEVTKYRDETRTSTVDVSVPVTKTRFVNLIQYLSAKVP